MLYKTNKSLAPIILSVLLISYSCGPVHRLTRTNKIPREYSLNYCGGDIKAPKTDLNKEPWIVYSDREKNESYNNAGGKVKAKDIDYLEPFLVIGKKNKYEYLKLIKYTPEILKNGKLDYKKAEYYGWIHKSKLLLNQQSVTDIASGKKNKSLTIFADTIPIENPEKFFAIDSIKLYKDTELKTQVGTLSPYSIIYQLKESEDGMAVLIAKKPYIKPEEVKNEVLGWIDKSLIKDIGTGLHVNLNTVPSYTTQFLIKRSKPINITEDISAMSAALSEQYQTIKYNPVSSYSIRDSQIAFKTRMALPIFDYSNNYIFNVDGNPISQRQFRTIARELKKINITFVFEGGEQTISQFPQIVNALQNLQALFEQTNENYSYLFNCVMTFDETGKLLRPLNFGFTSDYSQIVNFLSDKAESKVQLRAIKLPRGSWSALHKAVDACTPHKDATNLIVLIGDRMSTSGLDATLTNKLLQNNCRIIGFQVYAGDGDDYNNFVLDVEDMINSYADGMIKKKRDILVSPEQIKRMNHFKQAMTEQNGYRLDFPNNSITQGGLFFPQKSKLLPMEILTNNVDTIIRQIKEDNRTTSQYISKAFRTVGNNRTKFDSLFVQNYNIDTTRIPQKKLIRSFINETPGWYMPSKTIVLEDSTNKAVDYRLLLSEREMKELKEFVASLSDKEVDFIDEKEKKDEKAKRKPCNCPEDDLFIELDKKQASINDRDTATNSDSIQQVEQKQRRKSIYYANTKKIRKHLTKILLKSIKYCKLCKEKNSDLKYLTLAEAQYRITGSPVATELLQSIQIKDLKNKEKVTDEQLEKLILYYKKMKKELDKAEQFESNGEIYYWVDRRLLP